jgi:hypothetical protein
MATVTSVPGVTIEEDALPAISVSQGATAVPLFIADFKPRDDEKSGVITRISSWLSFTQLFSVERTDAHLIGALRLYFLNGGGACYVFALKDIKSEELDRLIEQIESVGDITLLSVPENKSDYRETVYRTLLTLLNKNLGYFLLADSAGGDISPELGKSSHVAVYFPSVSTAVGGLRVKDVKTSAVMAGVYCKTDRERGVWKAPANVVLNGVSDASVRVTNEQQAEMNPKGINVIRHFSDRGLVVWGCRTQRDDDDWRYIPVRRLFDAAERDIKKALHPMVFEPNNQLTWKRVQTAIEHYLYRLWQQGALAGNKAEEAYFVRVGKGITMTQDEINQGQMFVQVGMAAVRPAEFIILKFTQDMSQ